MGTSSELVLRHPHECTYAGCWMLDTGTFSWRDAKYVWH